MKSSFVQIFDTHADAKAALGFMTGAYPTHHHLLIPSSNQIQFWTTIGGKTESKTYGAPDATVVYMVVSAAPD